MVQFDSAGQGQVSEHGDMYSGRTAVCHCLAYSCVQVGCSAILVDPGIDYGPRCCEGVGTR